MQPRVTSNTPKTIDFTKGTEFKKDSVNDKNTEKMMTNAQITVIVLQLDITDFTKMSL